MKIRQGFVSNSSSSSFLLLVEAKWFDECFEKSDAYIQHVINQITGEGEIFGIKCKFIEGWDSYSGVSYLDELTPHPHEESYDDAPEDARFGAVDDFIDKVSVKKNKVYFHETDL